MCLAASNGGSWSQEFLAWTAETGDENATAWVIMCSPFVNNIIYGTPSFVETVSRRKTDALYTHLTYRRSCCSWQATLNDVDRERFRNGPFHECDSPKARQMCKVHTKRNLTVNYSGYL